MDPLSPIFSAPSTLKLSGNRRSTSVNGRNINLACTVCRLKHLKCDGSSPCVRCAENGLKCEYTGSRRGYKGPRRQLKWKVPATISSPNFIATPSGSALQSESPDIIKSHDVDGASVTVTGTNSWLNLTPPTLGTLLPQKGRTVSNVSPHVAEGTKKHCTEAYFRFFNAAHPFLLPAGTFLELLAVIEIPHLAAAVYFIGSFYIFDAPTTSLAKEVARLTSIPNVRRDGFMVQTLLLLAVGLSGSNEQIKADEYLKRARTLALELGMNQRGFAIINAQGSPILEECWRRTWWELYVVDGIFASKMQRASFPMNDIAADVCLPCEEEDFELGRITSSYTIEDFDDAVYLSSDIAFSSYTYRIAAIRNLARVLQTPTNLPPNDPTTTRVDAYLVNWERQLPDTKSLPISSDGKKDHLLFQALMITNASSILLHRHHSQLNHSSAQNISPCSKPTASPPFNYNIHTSRIISAANAITTLLTLPIPLVQHSHFLSCIMIAAAAAHLSFWASLGPLDSDCDLKQSIQLIIRALKALGGAWPSTRLGLGQVEGVAKEIFGERKRVVEELFWAEFVADGGNIGVGVEE